MHLSRRSEVEPFHAMDLLAAANRLRDEGRSILSLAVGQPSAQPPIAVREAAAGAIRSGTLGYTDAVGRADLRDRIARHYGDHYGVDVPRDRIVVTTGSSAGFALSFLALFDAGARVAIERPGYPAYRNIMRSLGLEPVEVDRLDGKTVAALHRAKGLAGVLVASPGNPTGTVVSPERMGGIVRASRELGVHVISDEIYHRLTYGDVPDRTALSESDDVIVINSFSKYYCMTGWRIGWMVVPEWLLRPVERVAQSLYISAPEASQIGAMHAFEPTGELDAVRDTYAANRRLMVETLPRLGFPIAAPPDGAFYAWCDIGGLTDDAMRFSRDMLTGAGVAAPSGHDFDPRNGHRTMRFSYAGSPAEVAEALQRIEAWL